jgi:hypothetical protein
VKQYFLYGATYSKKDSNQLFRISNPIREIRSLTAILLSVILLLLASLSPISSGNRADASGESITVAPLSVATSQSATPVGVTLSGFDNAKKYIAVISVSSGQVSVSSNSGITASLNYPALGVAGAEISFSGLYPDVATAIGTLKYHAPATAGSAQINLEVSEQISESANFFYWGAGNRYYEYVAAGSTITWEAAKTAASAKVVNGLQGYLATITSEAENNFIAEKTTASNIWIGAGRKGSDATDGRIWTWLTGPENGKDFFQQNASRTADAPNGTNINFALGEVTYNFSSWANGEPNGSHNGTTWNEDKAVTNWNSSKGKWNDLIGTSTNVSAYLVEYGGMVGDSSTISRASAAPQTITVRANGGGTPQYPSVSVEATTATGNSTRDIRVGNYTVDDIACPVPEVTASASTNLGTLTINATGVTVEGNGTSSISVKGTPSSVQTALNTMSVKSDSAGTANVTTSLVPSVNASVDANTILLFNPDNGHYYRVLRGDSDKKYWDDAYLASESEDSKVCGVKGYLATITTEAENNFISQNALKTTIGDIWVGGKLDSATGKYIWTGGNNNGPASEYNLPVYSDSATHVPAPVTSSPWQPGEPNGLSNVDSRIQLWFTGGKYGWDDTPKSAQTKLYLTEYGNNSSFSPSSTTVAVTINAIPSQTITWSPSNLSAQVGSSPLTPDALPTSTGDVSITFSVLSPGTTNCTVDPISGAVTFTSAGECVIRATASGTDSFAEAHFDLTFTFTARPASDSGALPIPAPTPNPGSGSTGGNTAPSRPSPTPTPTPSPSVTPAPLPGPAPLPPTGDPTGATVGGEKVDTEISAPSNSQLDVKLGESEIKFKVDEGSGSVSNADGKPQLEVKRDKPLSLEGDGMLPGSTLQVWLPTLDGGKELGRITVGPDGSYSGSVSFQSAPNERPLPIGQNVIQVTGLDSNGNQVVLNMNINIAQPTPSPELLLGTNVTPAPGFGNFLATNGGSTEQAVLTALPSDKAAVVEGNGWKMSLALTGDGSGVREDGNGVFMTLIKGEGALFAGDGFMPGTIASIWLFSDPIQIGEVTINPDGTFSGETDAISDAVASGEHTIQIQGVGADGYIRAANLGVLVSEPSTASVGVAPFFDWLPLLLLGLLSATGLYWLIARRRRRKPEESNVIQFPRAA